jgi:predicted lipoprotein with Yx(FWY)xxD motif
MTRVHRAVLTRGGRVAAIIAAVVVCGAAAAAVARTSAATVTTHHGRLGLMLAAGNGHTLYLFVPDKNGKSTCYGSCPIVWSPLLTHGRPVAAGGAGVNSRLLGTASRRTGTVQATYNGHPLYLYTVDAKAGDMHGENANQFGGRWYAVGTSGNALKPKQKAGTGYGCPGCPQGY